MLCYPFSSRASSYKRIYGTLKKPYRIVRVILVQILKTKKAEGNEVKGKIEKLLYD